MRSLIMFQTFISRHNSNFFSDKLVLTSVIPSTQTTALQMDGSLEFRLVLFRSLQRLLAIRLFLGASLEGAVIGTRKGANERYYGRPVSAYDILSDRVAPPPGAANLRAALSGG